MQVGFGIYDITPRLGVQMYGFGPYLNRSANRIYDRLEARAAAFEDREGNRFLLITCDLGCLERPQVEIVRDVVVHNVPGLAPTQIMVTCSHSHSTATTGLNQNGWGEVDRPYLEILPWKIAQAGINAFNNMEEGRFSQALVECRHIGLNRVYDRDAPPLEEVLNPDWEPAHPELTDTVCRVIRFDNAAGQLKGFWVNFGCHPVTCCETSHAIHGDYPGVAMHKLMAEMPGTTGLFLQGAHGDVNTGCVHKQEEESLNALPIFAERFASAIRCGLKEATPLEHTDLLKYISRNYDISRQECVTKEELLKMRETYGASLHRPDADDSLRQTRLDMVYLMGVRKYLEDYDKPRDLSINVEVQALRIGDLEFLGAPFEIMQAIKNDVLAAARAPMPMVMSMCNGYYGYAPDNTQLKRNGYESRMNAIIHATQPYADIHDELLKAFLELDAELDN